MDVDQLLYHYVTDGIANNHHHLVGMELEFPIVSLKGDVVTPDFAEDLFGALESVGMKVSRAARDGTPLAAKDENGNVLTFDTCYENLEFASGTADSMWDIYRSFRRVLACAQQALNADGLSVLGVGCNPLLHQPHMIESELTLALAEYVKHHPTSIRYVRDFYCGISSEQVHFNTTVRSCRGILETFTRLDWLNIVLFADSPMLLDGRRYLCVRNELYMRSPFARLGLVGSQPLGLETAMDIARSYRDLGLFLHREGGKLTVFPPEKVSDYYKRPDADPDAVNGLDLSRNIVTTSYGTVEYRILCSQPFPEAFTPSAFNLGLRLCLPETLAAARAFDARYALPEPNERNRLASLGEYPFASREDVRAYAADLLAIARKGLRTRGRSEERFLEALASRRDLLDAPACRLLHEESAMGLKHAFEARGALGRDLTQA